MEFKFGKETDTTPRQADQSDKGRQNLQLVVLLILVGGFAYIYFFTGLIKPMEPQKPAEPPPQVVKKPLPPREEQAATTAPAPAPEAKHTAAATTGTAPQKVAAVQPPAATPPLPLKQDPKKPEPSKPAAAPTVEKKPAAETSGQKPVPPKTDEKKTPPAAKQEKAAKKPAKKEAAATVQKATSGPWTVTIGTYVLEEALAADMARARKAGLETVVQQGNRRKSTMNRLLLGEYADRTTAQAELDKLKRFTADAFILESGGKFSVYAGSYLLDARAGSEKERLADAGIKLTLKRAEVALPSKSLTAGTFSDRKAAEAAVKKLKDLGIKATLSH
jgi:cell division septation protein DedD